MTVTVCSLVWGTAWERYGKTFAASFARHWPASVELVIVSDANLALTRGVSLPLQGIAGVDAFRRRWGNIPKASGIGLAGAKVDGAGYSWRHDALKWMPQALAPMAVIDELKDGDIFVWLDADVETTAPVPRNWVQDLLGICDVACLQRAGTHSEIGFYALRVSDKTRLLLDKFASFYRADKVFELWEWHSAFVFDRCLESIHGLVIRNLNPGGKGHVWPHSPLAACTVHKKGKRKDQ
ncbi:hypothetical protein [Mesorhizobium silamurunense]|uniref:hypothetical protein n=1 Tax=Mesorhizobium silamurunense TaxID=499528 RepID=UPI00177E6520|nr:hypothetical protein [Mesorhizobium silamurunense]